MGSAISDRIVHAMRDGQGSTAILKWRLHNSVSPIARPSSVAPMDVAVLAMYASDTRYAREKENACAVLFARQMSVVMMVAAATVEFVLERGRHV